MGLFLKFFAFIMSVILALFVKTPVGGYEPDIIEINGVKYKNCFVNEYVYLVDECFDEKNSEPIYTELGGTKWYSITDKIITCGRNRFSQLVSEGELVYCIESEWDSLKNYYYDTENWNCYMKTRFVQADGEHAGEPFFQKEFERVDSNLWNKMMVEYNGDILNQNVTNLVKLPYCDDALTPRIQFYMKSKDGLFGAFSQELVYYNGKYYFTRTRVSEMYVEANEIPNDLQAFIEELVGEYKLFNPF